MPSPNAEPRGAGGGAQPLFERLLASGPEESAAAVIERYGLWRRPIAGRTNVRTHAAPGGAQERAHVALNMVSSVDGSATLSGRSAGLSSEADRAHFHALRAASDAVIVGAGTARAERYGRIIRDAAIRRERLERGLSEEPLACIVTGTMASLEEVPLLQEPQARVVILTASTASLRARGAQVEYLRCEREGRVDLAAALAQLRASFGVQSVLCEGGPHLARELVAHGLVDELFLSLSPLLAGDGATSSESLQMLAGGELDPPARLQLRDVLRNGSMLFLRYAVGSGARVA